MKTFASIALVATACAATPALAQENPGTQVYAGPVIGYDNVSQSGGGATLSGSGVSYGGVVGVDAPMGERTRIGIETEFAGSTASRTTTAGALVDKFTAGRDLSISVKLGYMVTPKLETYMKLGYTNAKFSDTVWTAGAVTSAISFKESGYRLGAGLAYYLDKVRLRAEYRYSNYGDLSIAGVATGTTIQRHQVMAGMTYGF